MISSARITASTVAHAPARRGARSTCSPRAPIAERGERDAELHRRDEARRVGGDAQHGARAPVALALELADPRAPRGDEAVLGRRRRTRSAGSGRARARSSRARVMRRRRSPARRVAVLEPARRRPSSARIVAEPSGDSPSTRTYVLCCADAGRVPRGAVQGRPEPRQGDAVRAGRSTRTWAASHRCTFCYVRAFELRADRPADAPLRHVDPRQGERRRGAASASSRAARGAARPSRSAPPPTRTSRPRAATG